MILPLRGLGFKPGLPELDLPVWGLGDPGEKEVGGRSQILYPLPRRGLWGRLYLFLTDPCLPSPSRARPGGLQLPMSGDLTPGESVFHVREREAAWGAERELGGGIVEGGGRCGAGKAGARRGLESRADN